MYWNWNCTSMTTVMHWRVMYWNGMITVIHWNVKSVETNALEWDDYSNTLECEDYRLMHWNGMITVIHWNVKTLN